jgi:hypothetical protein
MTSWKPEVIADSSGKWCGNQLRFATKKEAEQNVADLASRWFSVTETRVVESDEPVNYTYHNRELRAVPSDPDGGYSPAEAMDAGAEIARKVSEEVKARLKG